MLLSTPQFFTFLVAMAGYRMVGDLLVNEMMERYKRFLAVRAD